MGDETPRSRLWQLAVGLCGIAASAYVGGSGSLAQDGRIAAVSAVAGLCMLVVVAIGLSARRRAALAAAEVEHQEARRRGLEIIDRLDGMTAMLKEHGCKLDEHHGILETLQEVVVADGELNISNAHSRLVHDATKYTCDRASPECPHGWCTQDEQDGWFRDYGIYQRRCLQMGVDNDVLDGARARMLAVAIRSY